jgi:hypothetical protein
MTDKAGVEIGLVEKYGRGVARIRPSGYSMYKIWNYNGVTDWADYRHKKDNGNWITMEMLVYNNPALKGKNEWYGKNLKLYSDDGVLLCLDTIVHGSSGHITKYGLLILMQFNLLEGQGTGIFIVLPKHTSFVPRPMFGRKNGKRPPTILI